MTDTVLVTGAFGLVGSATVRQLQEAGRHVVATDLDTKANRKAAKRLSGIDVRWCDLTDPGPVQTLLLAAAPSAVIHLAAMIPPLCYARPAIAHKVNVAATASLVRAARALSDPPRFVQASSIAVYGARNPHTIDDVLTAETPLNPSDVYGAHKVEAERIVRESGLDWVILRLGGVLTSEPRLDIHLDTLYFEGLLPSDGRIQTVDVRDAALAFVAATVADVVGETLLIGGDATHRLTQGDIGPAMVAAMGLTGCMPVGRTGDPSRPDAWFATDWMDTRTAQSALHFQRHSWPDMLAETARIAGWRRYVLKCVSPILRNLLSRRSPYRGRPGVYADPWVVIAEKWNDPGPAAS